MVDDDLDLNDVFRLASALVAEKGLETVSLEEVSAATGADVTSLRQRFVSVPHLIAEALVGLDDAGVVDATAEGSLLTAGVRLSNMIRESSLVVDTDSPVRLEWQLWLRLSAHAVTDEIVASHQRAMVQRWRGLIVETVRSGQASGEFNPDVDADRFALQLQAMIDGLALQTLIPQSRISKELFRSTCEAFCRDMLREP